MGSMQKDRRTENRNKEKDDIYKRRRRSQVRSAGFEHRRLLPLSGSLVPRDPIPAAPPQQRKRRTTVTPLIESRASVRNTCEDVQEKKEQSYSCAG